MNEGHDYPEQIDRAHAGETVLAHLAARWRHSTEATWRERIARGEVTLDGRVASADLPLGAGQWLVWARPPWDEAPVPAGYAVLHEDHDLLAVAKPSGLPTLPGGGFLAGTLLALVKRRHPQAGPVHRLGRGTSGLVLFAKHAAARAAVTAAWPQARKVYRALATGIVEGERVIELPIGPVEHPKLGTIHAASPAGRAAWSRVRPLEARDGATLVEVEIRTGRPHQIRIHLAAIGHPLVGDPLFVAGGLPRPDALPGDGGYRLHHLSLTLPHPSTGASLELRCEPPPPLRERARR